MMRNLLIQFLLGLCLANLVLCHTQRYVECNPTDPDDGRYVMRASDNNDSYNMLQRIVDLEKKGGTCTIKARYNNSRIGTCARVACGNTSGIFACHGGSQDLNVPCTEIANLARQVFYTCGQGYGTFKGHTRGSYSVYIGYADCRNSNDSPFYQGPRPGGRSLEGTSSLDGISAMVEAV